MSAQEHVQKCHDRLTELPGNVRILPIFCDALPSHWIAVQMRRFTTRSRAIVQHHASLSIRITRCTWVIDSARHPYDTIGICGRQNRLRVHVANRPAVRDIEMSRNVLTLEVTQAVRIVLRGPLITETLVVGLMH